MDTIAAPAGIKLDDGTGYFVSKCFPARSILGGSDDGRISGILGSASFHGL